MESFAIILAAGRGSRMKAQTEHKPKCLVELAGYPLLHWQEGALKAGGISDIHLVKGYKAEVLPKHFSSSVNARWADTNMLYSLFCAREHIAAMFERGFGQFVISYSDIVYAADHVRKLLAAPEDIVITYDTCWQELWNLRFADILEDAETFREEKGILREIGGKTANPADICGQYMGLLKLTPQGWAQWLEDMEKIDIRKQDMTGFLQCLLKNHRTIATVPVAGKWCEADSENDLACYEEALSGGNWGHDWRG